MTRKHAFWLITVTMYVSASVFAQDSAFTYQGKLISFPMCLTIQMMAFARLSDGTGQTVTSSAATWQAASASIATVSAGGLVQGVAPGMTAITATYQGIAGSLNVMVVP